MGKDGNFICCMMYKLSVCAFNATDGVSNLLPYQSIKGVLWPMLPEEKVCVCALQETHLTFSDAVTVFVCVCVCVLWRWPFLRPLFFWFNTFSYWDTRTRTYTCTYPKITQVAVCYSELSLRKGLRMSKHLRHIKLFDTSLEWCKICSGLTVWFPLSGRTPLLLRYVMNPFGFISSSKEV